MAGHKDSKAPNRVYKYIELSKYNFHKPLETKGLSGVHDVVKLRFLSDLIIIIIIILLFLWCYLHIQIKALFILLFKYL